MKNQKEALHLVIDNVEKVIRGKRSEIEAILATWLSGGHVLIEDVPGTGKTVLAKCLAKSIELKLGRVQFTPDLLPGDILGSTLYDKENHSFKFEKGPIFSDFFLADEINRATPRTQSALLESMAEGQVTVDNHSFKLDPIFFVMATQNPIEHHGTFPLPEAQLDRFAIKISLGHMGREDELKMAQQFLGANPLNDIGPVITKNDFLNIREMLQKVKISSSVYKYVLDIVSATRKHKEIEVGASPRATITFLAIARAIALIQGEDFVRPASIHQMAIKVLSHRVIPTQEALFQGMNSSRIIEGILKTIKTPIE